MNSCLVTAAAAAAPVCAVGKSQSCQQAVKLHWARVVAYQLQRQTLSCDLGCPVSGRSRCWQGPSHLRLLLACCVLWTAACRPREQSCCKGNLVRKPELMAVHVWVDRDTPPHLHPRDACVPSLQIACHLAVCWLAGRTALVDWWQTEQQTACGHILCWAIFEPCFL